MLPLIHSRISCSSVAWPSLDAGDGRDHLTWRAEPALKRVVLDERALHGVQLPVTREALDGYHLAPIGGRGQHHASVHPVAVEQHRTGAALAVVAALLGAG